MSAGHAESSHVRPHETSLAIWGVSTPVPVGRAFDLKVGVKCGSGCRLAGRQVRVYDEAGKEVGESCLGETPWPGTLGLYVAELRVTAPVAEGVHGWSGSFAGTAGPPPHEAASVPFSFRTAVRPEHSLSVDVSDGDTGEPLAGVDVFVGAYRATTDGHGVALLEVPKSSYLLAVRKRDYEAPAMNVEVDRDQCLAVRARRLPPPDPDEQEPWM